MPVVCPDPIIQIFNARTFRGVKRTGRSGHLAAQLEAEGAQMDCPNEKALNPLSGRCKYILSYYQRRKAARAAAIAAARSPSPARAVLIARQSRSASPARRSPSRSPSPARSVSPARRSRSPSPARRSQTLSPGYVVSPARRSRSLSVSPARRCRRQTCCWCARRADSGLRNGCGRDEHITPKTRLRSVWWRCH